MRMSLEKKRSVAKTARKNTPKTEIKSERPHVAAFCAPLRKLKKILVPIDFSGPSLKALRYAVPFAEQFGATISLVHVREPINYPAGFANPSPVSLACMQENEARKKLYDLGYNEIEELVPIDVHVSAGNPADEIVSLAQRLETDLIIIATHGYKGFMHLVMGSVAEKIVRCAPCPVLVVREKEHEFV